MDATAEGAMEAELKLLFSVAPKWSQATAAMSITLVPSLDSAYLLTVVHDVSKSTIRTQAKRDLRYRLDRQDPSLACTS